jgi:hypothetical protein
MVRTGRVKLAAGFFVYWPYRDYYIGLCCWLRSTPEIVAFHFAAISVGLARVFELTL